MNRIILLTTSALVLVSLILGIIDYDRLPDPVPTHFTLSGAADGFTPKPWGAFLLPLLLAPIGIVLSILPKISPRGYRLDEFLRAYEISCVAVLAVVFAVGSLGFAWALGYRLSPNRVIPLLLGLLLMVIGNFLGKLRRNFFIGIRTPWTLANDEVWLRTHRVGGWIFVLGGIVLMIGSFFAAGPILIVVVVTAAALITTLYSYLIYRRLEGRNP